MSFLLFLCVINQRLVADTTNATKDMKTNTNAFLFLRLYFVFQETDPFSSVNLILPGSLLPFKKEIVNIFRNEKQILFRKQRYAKVFRDISIEPVFANRSRFKNLVVKTKIA